VCIANIATCRFVDIDHANQNAAQTDQGLLQQALDIPPTFWSPTLQESSGFFIAREQAEESDETSYYDTWFRFLVKMPRKGTDKEATLKYEWYKLSFFTRWQSNGISLIVAFDLPLELRKDFQNLDMEKAGTGSPFASHGLLLGKICNLFDSAVWACRDLVRAHEKHRPSAERPQLEYEDLHEIARHAIHSTEMLATAINVVEAMVQEHKDRASQWKSTLAEREAKRSLQYHKTLLQGFHLRSQALESRLGNELNLVC
jgi:hypothetical protein